MRSAPGTWRTLATLLRLRPSEQRDRVTGRLVRVAPWIVTALARRLRRFNDVAYATLVGHVVGVGGALVIGLAGYGLWALIAQRLLVVVARAIILQWVFH